MDLEEFHFLLEKHFYCYRIILSDKKNIYINNWTLFLYFHEETTGMVTVRI